MAISQSDRYDPQRLLQTVLGEKMGNLEVCMDARSDMIDLQLTQLSKRVSYAITSGLAIFATLLALLIDLQFSV